MEKTKFSLLISLLLLTFTLTSFAQEKEKPIDLTGKFALQFQIDRYFTLDDFQGGTFSGKYHFNNSSALRLGVSLNIYSEDYNRDYIFDLPDTSFGSTREGEMSFKDLMFIAEYLHYFSMNDDISMYLGAGINYNTQPFDGEETQNEDDISIKETTKYERSGYGAQILIGVEWFVRSNIGLSAEYSSRYNSFKDEITTTIDDNDGSKITEIRNNSGSEFSYDRIKFGVSIYF